MYVSFNDLPDSAKVWIYQSPRKFSESDKQILNDRLRSFTESWVVHGEELRTSFDIVYDRFVVLAADDVASGCSIDSSVKVMRELAGTLGVDLFDRTQISLLIHNEIRMVSVGSLKSAFAGRDLAPDTLVFNNAISTLHEYRESWPAPARKTWLSRYFPKETVEK